MQKPRILIVDDAPEQLQLLLGLLKDDYHVMAAKNGRRALELLQEHPDISVVLLDVTMPEMDGYEVCRAIAASPQSSPSVIFVSANDSAEEIVRGFELGAADYLTKPVRPIVLKNKIAQLIAEPEPATAGAPFMADSPATESDTYESVRDRGVEACQSLQRAGTLDRFENLLPEAFRHLGLNAAIALTNGSQPVFLSSKGRVLPLEAELLQRLSRSDRPPSVQQGMLLGHQGSISVLARLTEPTDRHLQDLLQAVSELLAAADLVYGQLLEPELEPGAAAAPPPPMVLEQAAREADLLCDEINGFLAEAHLTLQQEERLQEIAQGHRDRLRALLDQALARDL